MNAVAVTGAHGFVGGAIAGAFAAAGWNVTGLVRDPARSGVSPDVKWHRFDLHDADAVDLSGIDVLVHCAFEPYRTPSDAGESINVTGSRALFATARAHGVRRIVFMSSFAALATAPSRYGADKRTVEAFLTPEDIALRPGLIVGDGGVFRAMSNTLRRFRLAPLFFGGATPLYTIAIDDLAAAVVTLVMSDAAGTFTLAARDPVTIKHVYEEIARSAGVRAFLIPLPYAPILAVVEGVERLGWRLPIASGSLRGLPNMEIVDVPSFADMGIAVRSFAEVMSDARGRFAAAERGRRCT
jgi:nucleoside-diphosphate-sugar epimerase